LIQGFMSLGFMSLSGPLGTRKLANLKNSAATRSPSYGIGFKCFPLGKSWKERQPTISWNEEDAYLDCGEPSHTLRRREVSQGMESQQSRETHLLSTHLLVCLCVAVHRIYWDERIEALSSLGVLRNHPLTVLSGRRCSADAFWLDNWDTHPAPRRDESH